MGGERVKMNAVMDFQILYIQRPLTHSDNYVNITKSSP